MFGQAPFQGVGAAAYAPTVEHALGLASNSGTNESGVAVGRLVAHNTFFSVLVEEGAIGFALFLALLLTLVLSAWKLPHLTRPCILVVSPAHVGYRRMRSDMGNPKTDLGYFRFAHCRNIHKSRV